jgi:hypothetical protein
MDTEALFRQSRGRPITYQESHDELLQAYDEVMGLDTYPCGVGMAYAENPLEGSLLSIWYETYARESVWDIYHIDFDSFLDRPRYEIEMMLKNIKKIEAIKNRAKNAATQDLERQQAEAERGHRAK